MNLKLLSIILVCCTRISTGFVSMQNKIILDRSDVCDLAPHAPIILGNPQTATRNHVTYVNITLEVTRIVERLKAIVKVHRCANKDSLDSCEFFTSFTIKDVCPLLKQKGTILSSVIYSYKPPFICPFKKTTYALIDGSYDPTKSQFFPLDDWYWKVQINIYDADTNEYFLRICIDGQVVRSYQ